MAAYYNENDPYAAQWLRNLIDANLIAKGDVDERSIVDVRPDDLANYAQCHFFAGIGGWSYALRLAEWPDDRPVWTGSCPCQPFSQAGKLAKFQDERDLWPTWFKLIRECTPSIVFGEQVANATIWLDRVFDDLEGQDYAVAAAILPACAVDAPHRRDRLWFVADATRNGRDARRKGNAAQGPQGREPHRNGFQNAMADSNRGNGFWWSGPLQVGWNAIEGKATASGDATRTQWRIKPGVPLLANGIPNRVERLCAYGNAIVPQVAAQFIIAITEAT